jgi:hypothetical protein
MQKLKSKTDHEERFSNSNWKRVLAEIWDYAPNRYGRGKGAFPDDHPLAKKLKLKSQELRLIVEFLEEQGLVEFDKQEQNWLNLTPRGFDVALRNEEIRKGFAHSFVTILLSATVAYWATTQVLGSAPVAITVGFFGGLGFVLFWRIKRNR